MNKKITINSFEKKKIVGIEYLSLKKTVADYYNLPWLTIEPRIDGKFCLNSDNLYHIFDTVDQAIDFINLKLI